jgi:hypothetical protein
MDASVEAQHHAVAQHLPQLLGPARGRPGDLVQARQDALHDPVDVGEDQLLFALEVQVDGALADAGFRGDVSHRHPAVAVAREQQVHRVQDGRASVERAGDGGSPHGNHNTRIVFWSQAAAPAQPNVNANASTPGARKRISKRRSSTAPRWRTSW